jgi:hypothetical protein
MKEMNEMKEMSNYFIATLFATLLSLPVMGQDGWKVVHGDCTPAPEGEAFTRGTPRRLPAINKNWDADRIYKQMVILIEFDEKTPDDTSDDTKFTMESPLEYYDKLFNEPDHHERNSNGCIADYFRDQSGGKLNLSFDVYGPVLVNEKAQPYDEPTSKTKNLGQSTLIAATKRCWRRILTWTTASTTGTATAPSIRSSMSMPVCQATSLQSLAMVTSGLTRVPLPPLIPPTVRK